MRDTSSEREQFDALRAELFALWYLRPLPLERIAEINVKLEVLLAARGAKSDLRLGSRNFSEEQRTAWGEKTRAGWVLRRARLAAGKARKLKGARNDEV